MKEQTLTVPSASGGPYFNKILQKWDLILVQLQSRAKNMEKIAQVKKKQSPQAKY